MKNFEFYSPTKIYFGVGRELETGQILKQLSVKKVLVVIGQNSVIKSGLLERVTKSVQESEIEYVVLSGVRANPTFDLVKRGVELIKGNGIDFILPIGGGSVIDTAKCISVNVDYDGDIKDFNLHIAKPTKAMPIGVVLTISAAGSELSNSCVIQDDETGMKAGFNSDLFRPVFAIENPELTYSVSKEQTAYGIVDILMHSLERYFNESGEYELADEFALGLIKNVVDVGLLCYNNPTDYNYRARIMLASSLSHNGTTSIGKSSMLFAHQLEHPLSGMFPNIAHGCGLAVVWPAWATYYLPYESEKLARLGRRVFALNIKDDMECAKETINLFKVYFKKLDMPSSLRELGVKESDIEELVDRVTRKGKRVVSHHKIDMDEQVVREIYKSCY